MTDQDQKAQAGAALNISDDIRAKYPELIELIVHSESMNNEERQYWINILPVMTPDQMKNLQNILVNEKKQLAAIDKKYAKEIESIGSKQLIKKTEEERRKRRTKRQQTESQASAAEQEHAEDILHQISEA